MPSFCIRVMCLSSGSNFRLGWEVDGGVGRKTLTHKEVFELFLACHACSSKHLVVQIRSIHRLFLRWIEFHLYLCCRGDSMEYIHARVCYHFFILEISESLILTPSPTFIFHHCLCICPRLELFNCHRFWVYIFSAKFGKENIKQFFRMGIKVNIVQKQKSRLGTVAFDAIFYKHSYHVSP